MSSMVHTKECLGNPAEANRGYSSGFMSSNFRYSSKVYFIDSLTWLGGIEYTSFYPLKWNKVVSIGN